MSTTFFTSDTHFNHKRIVELSHRPFADVDEMAHVLITNWNNRVTSDDDIVWHLGDLSIDSQWAAGLEAMRQCRGRKRLITGNHDAVWTGKSDSHRRLKDYFEVFESVGPWDRTKIEGTKVNLSHFPYVGDHTEDSRFEMYRLRLSDRPLIHGHTHASEKLTWAYAGTYRVAQVHVGVDAWDFNVVSSHQIAELLTPVFVQ